MTDEYVNKYDEITVPAWVVQQAVAKALGVKSVRGIENRGDSRRYCVFVEREGGGDD